MTNFLFSGFGGIALGCQFALIVLGFVVIYRATGTINFAQGGFLLLGAYMTHQANAVWGINFYVSILIAMAVGAAVGVLIEWLVLRHIVGEDAIAMIMITIGLLFMLEAIVQGIWGPSNLNMGDPWGINSEKVGDVTLAHKQLWTIALTAITLLGFFAVFRFTKLGVAMRAVAIDPEAALAQGISTRRITAVSWGISGAVAALAGVTAGAGVAQVSPLIAITGLIAFPAMILGGLDSPLGAVVGGIIIGLVRNLTNWAQIEWPDQLGWLGTNFGQVSPFLVMILILLIRPYGLFGTKEVRRV